MLKLRPLGFFAVVALLLVTMCSSSVVAADREPDLREKMLLIYVHGVNEQLAREVVRDDELPALRALLADPAFPRRDNVVYFLAYRDGEAAVAPLLAFLANPPASVEAPEEDRAILFAPRALGHIARRGSRKALEALLAMSGSNPGVLAATAARGSNPGSLLLDLQERALRGLALSEAPESRARLISIASGDIKLSAARDFRVLAGEMVLALDEGKTPTRVVAPDRTQPLLDGAYIGGPAFAARPPNPDEIMVPNAVDTSVSSHDKLITWANHAAVSNPVTASLARDILRQSTVRASTANFSDDISCCVTVHAQGSALTFGSIGDGLDTIDSSSELNAVLGNGVARVKVVREINYCGGPGGGIIGCAPVPGNSMTVVRFGSISQEGALWYHEYGHNTGLQHSTDSRAIMFASLGTASLVSQAECNSYHNDGNNVGPTCHDNDGDLIGGPGDNCPNASNSNQADQDGDGIGDVCDACPTLPICDTDGDGVFDNVDNCVNLPNAGQADGDSDNVGDACDPCPQDPFNDADQDMLCYPADNCPAIGNPTQLNSDGDSRGDACDPCPFDAADDADGDTFCADVDNCPALANPDQADQDGDGIGNACDADVDGDGTNNATDNCPSVANAGQQNADGDNHGDACDPCPLDAQDDADGDGLCANADNCPAIANADQTDWDSDNVGNPCDNDREGDNVANATDNCPDDPNPLQEDRNQNGIGNACDQIRTVAHVGPAQYGAIQAAIDAASPGDIVVVAPGTYHEHLTMKAGVDVVGPGPSLATVDGTGAVDVPIVSMIDLASHARLSGFKITGSVADTLLWGGGVQIVRSDAELDGNLISGNHATLGGGLYVEGDSGSPGTFAPIITNNIITGNDVVGSAGGVAIYYGGPGWKIRHNTVASNTSADSAGGIQVSLSPGVEISNNVVSGNSSASGFVADGLSINYSPGLSLHHNDVHGNASGNYAPGSDPTGTNGNLSVAPGFTNPGAGDYSPGAGSPLIDAGSDPADPPRDEAGRPRPLEGNGAAPSRADIGALERVVADADGDLVPNASDNCPYVANAAQTDSDSDTVGNACDNCVSAANANQSDLDRDGVGDVCDNCPVVSNPTQTDSQGHGVGDACALLDSDSDGVPDVNDCAPANPAAFFAPTEIQGVGLSGKVTTVVTWSAQNAGSSTVYDVAGGTLGELRADLGFTHVGCLANNQTTAPYNDARANPGTGNGYYYLLRAANVCGIGTYGHGSGAPDPRNFLNTPGNVPCP